MIHVDIPALNDMHVHFREVEDFSKTVPPSAKWCDNVLAMPNLKEPLILASRAASYRSTLWERGQFSRVLGSIYLTDATTVLDIDVAADFHIDVAKAYPKAHKIQTTGAHNGVSDYEALYPVFSRMSQRGMVLSLHGEHPRPCIGHTILEAEEDFMTDIYLPLRRAFPALRIVLEHITTACAVTYVERAPSHTAATITAHHLFMVIDDWVKKPRNVCMPLAKWPDDRAALIRAAVSGDPRFFLGSDSAPHAKGSKFCEDVCAGCYTAPYLPSLLATIFEQQDAMNKLPGFVNYFGRDFYKLKPTDKKIRLTKGSLEIPREQDGYLPFKGGDVLSWIAEQAP